MVICADDPALKNGEIALNRIRMSIAANVLASAVVNHFVTGKFFADVQITAHRVRHKRGLRVNMRLQDRPKRLAVDARDTLRADAAGAFHKRMHNDFARAADVLRIALVLVLVLLASADERRIGFHDFAFAAKHPGNFRRRHALADAMGHKPSRAIRSEA